MTRLILCALLALASCAKPSDANRIAQAAAAVRAVAPVLMAVKGITVPDQSIVMIVLSDVETAAATVATNGEAATMAAIRADVGKIAPLAAHYLPAGSKELVALETAVVLMQVVR